VQNLLLNIFGKKMKKTFGFVVFIILISIFLGCTNTQYIAKIGSQVWMAKNLNVEHYRNGDPIPQVQDGDKWRSLETGAWCYYDNDSANGEKYGKLYNWYAVNDARGLAPEGWHIPTLAEFKTLKNTVGDDGNTLKAIGQGSGYGAGTNTSGFSALLAGQRQSFGLFDLLNYYTSFWSSTEHSSAKAVNLFLNSDDNSSAIPLNKRDKASGFSVRCLKD
jgi:uncharacterized protein (TIGR02145 family)